MWPGRRARPESFSVLPKRGWVGSVTVTWPSHSSVTRGVLRWLGFPGPRLADQAAVEVLVDPFAPRQLQDLLLGHRGHGREVVGVEVLGDRERRLPDASRQR